MRTPADSRAASPPPAENLVYLASRDGWGAEEFFHACEGKEKLLVLASSRAEAFVEPDAPWGPTHLFGAFSEATVGRRNAPSPFRRLNFRRDHASAAVLAPEALVGLLPHRRNRSSRCFQ